MILTINKQTRVTRKRATSIDHIFTKTFMDRTFKSGILRSDVLYHFPIILLTPPVKFLNKDEASDISNTFVTDKAIA